MKYISFEKKLLLVSINKVSYFKRNNLSNFKYCKFNVYLKHMKLAKIHKRQ